MSYSSLYLFDNSSGETWTSPVQSFMPVDIAALVLMYGAATDVSKTNFTYSFKIDVPFQYNQTSAVVDVLAEFFLYDPNHIVTLDFTSLSNPLASITINLAEGGIRYNGSFGFLYDIYDYETEEFTGWLPSEDSNFFNTWISSNTKVESVFGSGGKDEIVVSDASGILIDGGSQSDVVEYLKSGDLFQLLSATSGFVIKNIRTGEIDNLIGIETVVFTDETISIALRYDIDGFGGQAFRLYQAAFDRSPDLEGLGYWMAALDHGQGDLDWVAANFINSDEFRAMYGQPGTVSNEQFLTLLYANVLDRIPDQGGLSFWVSQMNGGMLREKVLAHFSESAENQVNVIGAIQNGIEYEPWLG